MIQLSTTQIFLMIFIPGLITQLLRALPFVMFGRRAISPTIRTLGATLPFAIMAVLVVYCLRCVSFRRYSYGVPELIGIFITAGLHLWKRHMLLSIAAGTITYMLLIRYVFV